MIKNNRFKLLSIEKQIQDLDNFYLEKSKTNPLLKNYVEIEDYYKKFIDGFEIKAIIPTLPENHPKHQQYSYYSSGGKYAVAFTYNGEIKRNHQFIFTSEFAKLYDYEKSPYSKKERMIKSPQFEEQMKYINEHPVVLIFKGCDDGHVGRRFKTEKELVEYINLIEKFEDVFDYEKEKLAFHN